jgi:hypothetical protein
MRSRFRRHGSRTVPALVAVATLLGTLASAAPARAADIELAFKGGAASTPRPSGVNPIGASVGDRLGDEHEATSQTMSR